MLEVIKCFVRTAVPPLPDLLISDAFPAVLDMMLKTDDDPHAVNSGCDCLRAFVSASPEQVSDWSDGSSASSGLDKLVQVASHLLSLTTAENCGSMIGRLLTVMFTKCGLRLAHGHVDHLLRAVLSKMQQCRTQSVMQVLKSTVKMRTIIS
jgi:hypothetical protein